MQHDLSELSTVIGITAGRIENATDNLAKEIAKQTEAIQSLTNGIDFTMQDFRAALKSRTKIEENLAQSFFEKFEEAVDTFKRIEEKLK